MAEARPQRRHAPAESDAPTQTRRVLIVDDHADNADSLALGLRVMGHEVSVASTGAAALRLADEVRPQLILLDLGMPGLNGIDVCREIRAKPWGRHTVIVALTGWGQEQDRLRTRAAGFDSHLVK